MQNVHKNKEGSGMDVITKTLNSIGKIESALCQFGFFFFFTLQICKVRAIYVTTAFILWTFS
jgi:hypothetical protein